MKTSSVIRLIALLGILVLTIPEPAIAQKPEEIFQKGLIKEEGEGALLKAIDIYNEVASNESAERFLRAKALLHIGLCYEKLGRQEAQNAYRKIINQFPEQIGTVTVAREKLSRMAQTGSTLKEGIRELKIRKVWEGPSVEHLMGEPSPDGKYLSYVDWDTGDLAILDIATGKKRHLTNKGTWAESSEFAEYTRWSPDGSQIAYDWFNENNFIEIRIIGLDGSEPRILYRNENVDWIQTYDWSPDGKQILTCFSYEEGANQAVLIKVADGSVQILKSLADDHVQIPFDDDFPRNMCFTPDGQYILFDHPQKEKSADYDISMISTDGSRQISLVKHPSNDLLFGLAPDGESILFTSNRDGALSFYILKVNKGQPSGDPVLVKSGMGPVEPLGFTPEGSFYYVISRQWNDIHVAELDPENGDILSPITKLPTRLEGLNKEPDYSPDGKHLAYVRAQNPSASMTNSDWGGEVLVIRSLETGIEREIITGLNRVGFPRWSPDGKYILMIVRDAENQSGYYQINVQTGDTKEIISPAENNPNFGRHEWSPDGKSIYYGGRDDENGMNQIITRELETGHEKVLYQSKEQLNLSLSEDGQYLAISSRYPEPYLSVIPTAGGIGHELFRFGKDDLISLGIAGSCTWTIDGKYVLFALRDGNVDDPKMELCRIKADGGEIEKLGLAMKFSGFINLSVHPDGRHISFSSKSKHIPPALWVMENFLPGAMTGNKGSTD
jgi:Tol biopolymer transport system component